MRVALRPSLPCCYRVSNRVFESNDANPVPHDTVKTEDCESGVDPLSTTRVMMNKANENRVFVTLWIAIIVFIAAQLMNTRDSALTHEIRISAIEEDVKEIKGDVKVLLLRPAK